MEMEAVWDSRAFCSIWQYSSLLWSIWHSGSASVSSTKLTDVGPGYLWGGWPCLGSIHGVGHLSRYATSHQGQLSLAIPSRVGTMSTNQSAVMPCGWGVKAGMVRAWMAGKTVWSHCYTWAISERFRDKGLYKCICILKFYLLYQADTTQSKVRVEWMGFYIPVTHNKSFRRHV